jgi:hypothetical protein
MKEPVSFTIYFQDQFIVDGKVPDTETGKFAQGFIMVAGEVVYIGAFAGHFEDTTDYFGMGFWEITLAELPDIDNITVQH